MRSLLNGLVVVLAILYASGQQRPPAVAPVNVSDYREVRQHRLSPVEPIRVANKTGLFASIDLEVTVDAAGHVLAAKIVRARGASELTAAAVAQAQTWTYKPFERGGKAVPATFNEYIRLLPPEKLPKVHVPFPEILDRSSLRMRLRRTACFGTCPSYEVEIAGDGSVTFVGKSFVLMTGVHHFRISQETVSEMFEAFRKADYFSLDNDYQYAVTDCPTYETSISFDGHSKAVVDYVGEEVGMPHAVTELESAIDRLAGTQKWVTGNTQESAIQGRNIP